tara:strand:- start:7 stop:528 length:522 start_codon:yes stop_codon:yes gene_type:complete
MVTGLKSQSSTVAIGFSVTETGANTFTQGSVDLNLDPLSNEVFVVQAINLNITPPDGLAGLNTSVSAALTTTSQLTAGAVPTLALSNCLARVDSQIRGAGYVDSGVGFTNASLETPPSDLAYIGIIATNDFFLQVEGFQNAGVKALTGKLYGYRARADSSIYAALVQSEVLSA